MNRILVAVALTASLGTPISSSPLDLFWSALTSLWEAPASSKAGCGWDPSGLECAPLPPPQTEEGCGWDPSGINSCSPTPVVGPGGS